MTPSAAIEDEAGTTTRRMAGGAEIVRGGVAFRLWAPDHPRVRVVVDGKPHAMAPQPAGWHGAIVAGAAAGARYGFLIGDGETLLPDPVSRWQPDGPHGRSAVVDPGAFAWSDDGWPGIALPGQVMMEFHVGTFTPEGTWAAAMQRLPHLVALGVTTIEMMPVNDFPGRFGWGYDGVGFYAPTRLYGEPDDLRRFVDRAHALGLGVILDVVYNHLGPDGNYLEAYARDYFAGHANDWGSALNFDGPGSDGVRTFFVDNAAYWIREFHFDGLRLDATQAIHDASDVHIVAEIAAAARAAAGGRSIIVVAENEPQDRRLLDPPAAGGCGLDALWNDDFHHAARVALTGRREAYLSDYSGSAAEIAACLAHGFLFQGQRSGWQGKRRGTPVLRMPPMRLVTFLENHDQVANAADGRRLSRISQPGTLRALTAALLLGPQTPMLFQGQEFGAAARFLFFADHGGALAAAVRDGRHAFMAQFPSQAHRSIDDPTAETTFRACRLDWERLADGGEILALHRDLIALRRADPTIRLQGAGGLAAASLGDLAILRLLGESERDDRLLLVNLGSDVTGTLSLPLVAPPIGCGWRLAWSSEHLAYGGIGAVEPETDEGWRIPGRAAVLLAALEISDGKA